MSKLLTITISVEVEDEMTEIEAQQVVSEVENFLAMKSYYLDDSDFTLEE